MADEIIPAIGTEDLPDPNKLREIAAYIDEADAVFRTLWAASSDSRREEMMRVLDAGDMQSDLRHWADVIEKAVALATSS